MNEMKGGLRMYRLIIIDDEKEISQGFAQFFPWASLGFEVAGTFARAKEAIAFLENEAVDVIVSDVRMPGVTGLEMAEQINRQKLRGGAKRARRVFLCAAGHCAGRRPVHPQVGQL